MNRRQSRVVICFALATLAFSTNGSGQSKPAKKIRVGVPSVGMGNIITFVVKEGKLFEKYGLEAEVITVMGSGIGSKALISGNLDVIPIATPTVIAANLAGDVLEGRRPNLPGQVPVVPRAGIDWPHVACLLQGSQAMGAIDQAARPDAPDASLAHRPQRRCPEVQERHLAQR